MIGIIGIIIRSRSRVWMVGCCIGRAVGFGVVFYFLMLWFIFAGTSRIMSVGIEKAS